MMQLVPSAGKLATATKRGKSGKKKKEKSAPYRFDFGNKQKRLRHQLWNSTPHKPTNCLGESLKNGSNHYA